MAFGKWVEAQLAKQHRRVQWLAGASHVSRRHLDRIIDEDRTPRRETIEKIGRSLGLEEQALIAAGVDLPLTPRLSRIKSAPTGLHTVVEFFLDLLGAEKLYDVAQLDFLERIWFAAIDSHSLSAKRHKALESEFKERIPQEVEAALAERRAGHRHPLDPISRLVVSFSSAILPVVSLEYILSAETWRPFYLVGLLEPLNSSGVSIFRVKACPQAFPIAVLRPLKNADVSVRTAERIGSRDSGIRQSFLALSKAYRELEPRGRDVILSAAKSLTNLHWQSLGMRIAILETSTHYYDEIKNMYWNSSEVFSFCTTPECILPEEFYGSTFLDLLEERGKAVPEPLRARILAKNAQRSTLFDEAFRHGISHGCTFFHQIDLKRTAEMLQKGKKSLGPFYVDCAAEVLAKFLTLENFEIVGGIFDEVAKGQHEIYALQWRDWLTTTTSDFTILSAREPGEKRRLHGLMVRTELMDEALAPFFNRHLGSPISTVNFVRGLYKSTQVGEPIKKSSEVLRPQAALEKAKFVIQQLCTLTE